MIDDRIDQDPALRPFFARAAETGIRLATIRAAGDRRQTATVNVDDVYWGAGIVWIAGQRLYESMLNVAPETERTRNIKRILRRIRIGKSKKEKTNFRYIQQGVGKYLKSKEIKELVSDLVSLDLLRLEPDETLSITELGEV